MGFNTSAVIMNDALSDIEADPDLGRKLSAAVRELQIRKPVDVSARGHVNAITVLESHHADGLVPVFIGGNHGWPIDVSVRWSAEDREIDLLKKLADKFGFVLHRKGKKT